jgi:uncharacterized protein (TIGR02453 family)
MNFSNLLQFLSALGESNNKEWFHSQNDTYQYLRKEFIGFVQEVIAETEKFDPAISGQEAKKSIFRINRDIRFSKEKTPYKTNFGASISDGGKKSPKSGYYLHLEPGKSFLAGGLWMPESEVLANIRQEIDYNPKEFRSLIENKDFKNAFASLEGEKLRTVPRGYTADNEMIDILRMKSLVMSYDLSDKKLENYKASDVAAIFRLMYPVNQFFNRTFDH